VSDREREHDAMRELLKAVNAGQHLDRAAQAFAAHFDPSDTDEGMERVQSLASVAMLDALIHVARSQGWQIARAPWVQR
jgi:hypothetical protein